MYDAIGCPNDRWCRSWSWLLRIGFCSVNGIGAAITTRGQWWSIADTSDKVFVCVLASLSGI